METRWVYINSEPGLWTTGFYDPAGRWQGDADYNVRDDAAKRVHYLNGGRDESLNQSIKELFDKIYEIDTRPQ